MCWIHLYKRLMDGPNTGQVGSIRQWNIETSEARSHQSRPIFFLHFFLFCFVLFCFVSLISNKFSFSRVWALSSVPASLASLASLVIGSPFGSWLLKHAPVVRTNRLVKQRQLAWMRCRRRWRHQTPGSGREGWREGRRHNIATSSGFLHLRATLQESGGTILDSKLILNWFLINPWLILD